MNLVKKAYKFKAKLRNLQQEWELNKTRHTRHTFAKDKHGLSNDSDTHYWGLESKAKTFSQALHKALGVGDFRVHWSKHTTTITTHHKHHRHNQTITYTIAQTQPLHPGFRCVTSPPLLPQSPPRVLFIQKLSTTAVYALHCSFRLNLRPRWQSQIGMRVVVAVTLSCFPSKLALIRQSF